MLFFLRDFIHNYGFPWLPVCKSLRFLYPAQISLWIPNLYFQLLSFSFLFDPLLIDPPQFIISQITFKPGYFKWLSFSENSVSQSGNLSTVFETFFSLTSPPCLSQYNVLPHDSFIAPESILFFHISHQPLMQATIISGLNFCTSFLIHLIHTGLIQPSLFKRISMKNLAILPPPSYHPSERFCMCKPHYKVTKLCTFDTYPSPSLFS